MITTAKTAMAKAQLVAKEVGVEMNVCFNPKEFSVEKSATWNAEKSGEDEPIEVFTSPSPATMSVTLIFDTYEESEDGQRVSVYKKYTQKMEKLIHIVSKDVRRPPLTLFVWGRFCFQGIVEKLSQKYTMFLSDGTPVRCECTLSMKVAKNAKDKEAKAKKTEDDVLKKDGKDKDAGADDGHFLVHQALWK